MLNEQSLVRAFKTLIIDKLLAIVELIVAGTSLEPATASKLGGVKIGNGVNVSEDGTISVDGDSGEWTTASKIPTTAKEVCLVVATGSGNNLFFIPVSLWDVLVPSAGRVYDINVAGVTVRLGKTSTEYTATRYDGATATITKYYK